MPPGNENGIRSKHRTRPALLFADLCMIIWTAAWIFVAVRIGLDVRGLTPLTRTLHSTGAAVVATGHAASTLGHLPFIGGSFHHLGNRILAAGHNAESTAHSTRKNIDHLSILLPIVIALVPIVPVLVVYVPLRIQRWREARAVLSVMREGELGEARRFLANRAVTTLSFHQLEAVTADPWQDLESGRYEQLADAELRRLGILTSTRRRAS